MSMQRTLWEWSLASLGVSYYETLMVRPSRASEASTIVVTVRLCEEEAALLEVLRRARNRSSSDLFRAWLRGDARELAAFDDRIARAYEAVVQASVPQRNSPP